MEFSVGKQALNTGNLPTKGKVKSSIHGALHATHSKFLPPTLIHCLFLQHHTTLDHFPHEVLT